MSVKDTAEEKEKGSKEKKKRKKNYDRNMRWKTYLCKRSTTILQPYVRLQTEQTKLLLHCILHMIFF